MSQSTHGRSVEIGDTFGRLTVQGRPYRTKVGKAFRWVVPCSCACGAEKAVVKFNLLSGNTSSCGCYGIECYSKNSLKPDSSFPSVGDTFGRLTVCGPVVRKDSKRHKLIWILCRCQCGVVKDYRLDNLRHGTQSCGCFKSDRCRENATTHGEYGTRIYHIWNNMLGRCRNPNNPAFKDYQGRGITVDPEWIDFETFRDWCLNNGYSDALTLDRQDNDGPYSPTNCRFVDMRTQCRNRRTNVILTAFGESKTLAAWFEDPRCAVNYYLLSNRIRTGWEHEKAITSPVKNKIGDSSVAQRLKWIWADMRQRCNNPNHPHAKNYHDRGIIVCDEWDRSADFIEWATSHGYKEGLTLDRLDNNCGYSPDNCAWRTRSEQARNQRPRSVGSLAYRKKILANQLDR